MNQCEGRLPNGAQCPRPLGPNEGTRCPAHKDEQNKKRGRFWTTVGGVIVAIGSIGRVILRSGKNRST